MSWLQFANVLLMTSVAFSPRCVSAEAGGRAADEAAIRGVIAATTASFNAHDAERFTSYYTSDADLMTVRGEVMKGTMEIQSGLQRIFNTRASEASLREISASIRFVAQDVAIVHVVNELSGLVDVNGSVSPPHRERSIRVFLRTTNGWKVTAFQNTRLADQLQ